MMTPAELKNLFKGAIAVLLTPFNSSDFSLNEVGIRQNIRFMKDHGLKGGFIAGGSLSECYAMSCQERKRLFEIVVDEVAGHAPVVCCVNHSGTLMARDLAIHAEKIGADGVLLIPPYYMAANEESILLHFRMVCKPIHIGMVVYNNRFVSKVELSIEMLAKLAELENIIAVKDCTSDFFRFRQGIDKLGRRLSIFNCSAEFWEPYAYAMGSCGFMSAMANWAPEISLEVEAAGVAGDLERGKTIYQSKLLPYLEIEAAVANELGDAATIALYKSALDLRGLAGGLPRPPVAPLPKKWIPLLRDAMEKQGLL